MLTSKLQKSFGIWVSYWGSWSWYGKDYWEERLELFSFWRKLLDLLQPKDTRGSNDGKGKDSYYYWKADKATNSYVVSLSWNWRIACCSYSLQSFEAWNVSAKNCTSVAVRLAGQKRWLERQSKRFWQRRQGLGLENSMLDRTPDTLFPFQNLWQAYCGHCCSLYLG